MHLVKEKDRQVTYLEGLGIIAGPAAMFGSVYLQTNAMKHGYTAYKDMYIKGQDACTMRFNNFTEYYADQKTTPMDPKLGLQAAGMCNASPLSAYAGFGGMFGTGFGGLGAIHF